MKSKRKHLWKGEWINDQQLAKKVENLQGEFDRLLEKKLTLEIVINACEKLALQLQNHGDPQRPRRQLRARAGRTRYQSHGPASQNPARRFLGACRPADRGRSGD